MTAIPARSKAILPEARVLAALIVVAGLCAAQALYSASDGADWQGYQALYEGSADWLGPGVFTAFLSGARQVFGDDGYGAFRLALFIAFAGFAGLLAWRLPTQARLGAASVLMNAGAVLAAMGLKSVVQIREGLAFAVLLTGPPGALIAPLIHAGTAPLSALWLVAWSPWRVPGWLLAAVSAGAGLALAVLAAAHADEVATFAASLGVDTSAQARGGWLKLGYWAAFGCAVWVLRSRLRDGDRFGEALGSGLLPGAWAFCAALVALGFKTPGVTSLGVRVLITAMDLALLRICWRGRADGATAAVMIGMIGDELRLLATP
jgi:hypothetical protein